MPLVAGPPSRVGCIPGWVVLSSSPPLARQAGVNTLSVTLTTVHRMEDPLNATQSAGPSDHAQLHHRDTIPDVPEDVKDDLTLHFNDPNWDFRTNSSTTSISTHGRRHERRSTTAYVDTSTGVDKDKESQVEVTSQPTRESDADFPSEETHFLDSPYPEVRAAVANTDDPTMVVNTFRVWVIGLSFTVVVTAFNQIFLMRLPNIVIDALFVQLVTLPFGKIMAWILPKYRISMFGHSFSLNPGPFNIKEHALIMVMGNMALSGADLADITANMRILYGERWSIGKQFLLGLGPQVLGLSFAGIFRPFLVWPASMIWPGTLVRCTLLNTIHSNYSKKETNHISKQRFFCLVCLCSFLWSWIPEYLWTGLSAFTWVCWISPNNVVINNLFGSVSGLGMSMISLNWAVVSSLDSPLVVPWWAQLNMMGGFIVVIWIICPVLWAKNVFYSQFMPISAGAPFDNTGSPYNLSRIITNNEFDQAKYEQYSPLFLPITYAVTYGAFFALYPAVVVHTLLWYRRDFVHKFRRNLKDEKDIHSYLMRKYREVPNWWFLALGIVSFVLGVIGIKECHIGLPIWATVLSIIFGALAILPVGITQAISNQQIPVNVLEEIIIGYLIPGHPIKMMTFRLTGFAIVTRAMGYSSDMKFGHYVKIPPRLIFSCQVIASIVVLLSDIVAQEWAFDNIPDICSPNQKDFFTCPNLKIYNTSSILWGGIGPRRLFSHGALYYPMLWGFLIGAVLPIPFYLLARRYPRSFWRYVNIPLALLTLPDVPPLSGPNFASWILVGCIFQWFMRRFHFRWWLRYNYILASGLDVGLIFGVMVLFFTVQWPKGGISLNWWGNTVWRNTADGRWVPLKTLSPGQTFGPSSWS